MIFGIHDQAINILSYAFNKLCKQLDALELITFFTYHLYAPKGFLLHTHSTCCSDNFHFCLKDLGCRKAGQESGQSSNNLSQIISQNSEFDMLKEKTRAPQKVQRYRDNPFSTANHIFQWKMEFPGSLLIGILSVPWKNSFLQLNMVKIEAECEKNLFTNSARLILY